MTASSKNSEAQDPREQLPHESDRGVWQRVQQLPALVLVAMGLIFVQAAAVAIYTVVGIFNLVAGRMEHPSVGIALLVFTAALTWFLFALFKGVFSGATWVRGPAITLQIFVVLVGVSVVQGSMWLPGLLLMLFGIATIVVFLSRPMVAHLGVRELRQD